MAPSNSSTGINLPDIRSIIIRDFSLYKKMRKISIKIDGGVSCLAGANGLGKSTFLTAVNYCLTGIVPDPDKKYLSVEEYYHNSLESSEDYFEGRISEGDRKSASIEIDFVINKVKFSIIRGMFNPKQLKYLSVIKDGVELVPPKIAKIPPDLHSFYEDQIVEATALSTFSQFSFLQHFLLTFDERRHLLFWDEKVIEQALYLAFGVDGEKAKRADELRRKGDKADSLARNLKWQATQLAGKIKDIEKTSVKTSDKSAKAHLQIVKRHEELERESSQCLEKIQKTELKLNDCNLKMAELGAKQAVLQNTYNDIFTTRIHAKHSIAQHPLILESISSGTCGLCNSTGVGQSIQRKTSLLNCPICGEKLSKKDGHNDSIEKLKDIDKSLSKISSDIGVTHLTRERLNKELFSIRRSNEIASKALNSFVKANKISLEARESSPSGLNGVLNEYRRIMADLIRSKEKKVEERDDARRELRDVQKTLEKQYMSAEKKFVPMFKELATSFLGLDLDVRMQTKGGSIGLVLKVLGTERRSNFQLSESQKYFLDIALRMSIVRYICGDKRNACLYIDTPEGSLDIAYETKAGEMFSQFVNYGFDIIMTANINSSRLLTSLASQCKKGKMAIIRMTSWTTMSDVQIKHEDLFDDAFSAIEKIIRSAKAS
jgi:hypothetical protein